MSNPSITNNFPVDPSQIQAQVQAQAQVQDPTLQPDPTNPSAAATAATISTRKKEVIPSPVQTTNQDQTELNTPLSVENTPSFDSPDQSLDQSPVENGSAVPEQENFAIETEPNIEKMEAEAEQQKVIVPDKIAVRADNTEQAVPRTVAQPVVILPITEKTMKNGRHKSPQSSLRWLVGFVTRQIKKLKDVLVIYRD